NQANLDGTKPAGSGAKGPSLQRTCKVGSYPSNVLGLFDMHGNVWQWCEDLWGEGAARRVARGGCYLDGAENCRAGYRWHKPNDREHYIGFRLARVSLRIPVAGPL